MVSGSSGIRNWQAESRALRSLYCIKALSATGSFRRVQQGMVGTVENED